MLGFNVEDAIALQSQLLKCIENIEDDWTNVKTQWEQLKDCWHDRQYDRFKPFFQILSENHIKALEEYNKYSDFLAQKIQETKEIPELASKQGGLINSSIQNAANLNLAIGLSLNPPKNLEGNHGYKYQKERRKFLMSLANDPKQPKYIKGWIKQEERKIWNNKKFKKASDVIKQLAKENAEKNTNIKGRENRVKVNLSQYMRSPPTSDVGHRKAGNDEASNFRLELRSMNRLRSHIARKLGLPPIYF